MIYDAGLILEGGGMRCVYTAGVLDYFMDHDIWIANCYGVSAGALNATNYKSKQRGRTFRVTANYINDKRYCSLKNLITTGNLFGTDFVYSHIPNNLDIFDYNTFQKSNIRMHAVVTNVDKGIPEYKALTDLKQEMVWLRASCSLPMLANIVEIDQGRYLDGGISDSIPLEKSINDGNQKNIVILTRHDGYQKKPERISSIVGKLFYRKFPRTLQAGKDRHLVYNQQLKHIKEQERIGKVLVICPQNEVTIGRTEKDTKKLTALYEQGYADAKEKLEQIQEFLRDTNRI